MTTRIAALLAALAFATPALAQSKPAPAPAATDSVVTDTARLAAARDLLAVLHVQQQMDVVQKGMLDAMTATAHPAIRQVIDDWIKKYGTFAAMQNDFVQLYARTFTRDEMRQLLAFLNTPAGRHFVDASPTLSQEGMMIGQRNAAAHRAELEAAVQAKINELQGTSSPTKP